MAETTQEEKPTTMIITTDTGLPYHPQLDPKILNAIAKWVIEGVKKYYGEDYGVPGRWLH